MSNVDLEINLEDETLERLMDLYIKSVMESGSYEVFEREKNKGTTTLEAAGRAVLNDAIIVAMKLGIEADKKNDLDDKSILDIYNEERKNSRRDNITVYLNGEKHDHYPVGYEINYDEIAAETGIKDPVVGWKYSDDGILQELPYTNLLVLVDGMIIVATDPTAAAVYEGKINMTINGENYIYPAGHLLEYSEIAFLSESIQPSVMIRSPSGERTLTVNQSVAVEEGMIINAMDTVNA